jgi:hypothetical protein
MSDVEFLLSLYGILLGLSLTEVLGGLARMVEARNHLCDGKLLMAILGVLLLIDVALFWSWIWEVREDIVVTVGTILAGLAIAGFYYIAAYLSFPRTIPEGTDLIAHFRLVKRWVLGPVVVANLVALPSIWLLTNGRGWGWADYVSEGLYILLIAAALFVSTPTRLAWLFTGAISICLLWVVAAEIWPLFYIAA